MTINALLLIYNNTIHPPVSTPESVSLSIEWFNVVEVFCLENKDTVPNADTIIFTCEEASRNIEVMDTDYQKVNNYLYHVRCMLYAVIAQNE